LLDEVDEFLRSVWPSVMRDWQRSMTEQGKCGGAAALVTRKCRSCSKQVKFGVVIHPLSPERPAGHRSYCVHCKRVTHSQVIEVRGLIIRSDEQA
jgi:hypothetical protein